jgi:sec-independent protein translocase protein TatA
MIGSEELILIFAVAMLLFGANKLPELARSMGSSMGEFKKAQRESELNLREFGKPLTEFGKPLTEFGKPLTENTAAKSKIQETAEKLGIDIMYKTDDQLLDEIQKYAEKPKEVA